MIGRGWIETAARVAGRGDKTEQIRREWFPPRGKVRVGPLAVRVLGEGQPIVLLHGILGSNRYWGGAFDQLSNGRLLLVPDLLGFGASPRPISRYGPEEHGSALIRMLDDVHATEPALVVGHSLGALLAIWMASRYPSRVKAAVALCPPLFRDAAHARSRIARLGGIERLFALEGGAAQWLAEAACRNLCSARPRLAASLYSSMRPHLPYPVVADATLHSWMSYSGTLKNVILAAEGAQWLGSGRRPVLLVAGARDDYLDLQFLSELEDRYPHVQLDVWAEDGHDLPLTQPDRCLTTIAAWHAR